MAFGPESANPHEMRAYAHTMVENLADGRATYGEALEAAWRASLTETGKRSNFQPRLDKALERLGTPEYDTGGWGTIRNVPLKWQHPVDEEGFYEPLFDSKEGSRFTLDELSQLKEEGRAEGLKDKYMPTFAGVPDEEMGICWYEDYSEGTPLTPVFPNTEEGQAELTKYAAENVTRYGAESVEVWGSRLFNKVKDKSSEEQPTITPVTEIPREHWNDFAEVDYTADGMVATMEAFSELSRELGGVMPFNFMLGARGVIMATRIRLHSFGELRNRMGIKIDEQKTNPLWLGTEVMNMLATLELEAEQSQSQE